MTIPSGGRARPRVLFVTHHLPYPPFSGGRRREYELIARVSADYDVHVCAVTKTYDDDLAYADAFGELCASVALFPPVAGGGGRAAAPQVTLHASEAARAHVAWRLGQGGIELVHVEGFYLMQHVPDDCGVPILLDEQNVEFELWRQRMRLAADPHDYERLRSAWRGTWQVEPRAWRRADMCVTVTDDDAALMAHYAPALDVRVVPDGADHTSRLPGDETADDPEIAHGAVVMVGNLAYEPNADAALRMCREVFPLVRARVPRARLVIVGNAPSAELVALAQAQPGIAVTGRVPAVEPYLDAAAVVACPLRVGGGVKVKILEALSRGKAIVTTPVGVQGLGHDGSRAVRVASDDAPFAAAVADLLENVSERRALEGAAFALAARLPTWDQAAEALGDCYEDLIRTAVPRLAA
jgi:polysaccharide biosynthesis protein PslH